VNIQDPHFSTERVQVEFHLFDDGPGGQDHATYTTFDCIIAAGARSNRPGGILPRRPNRWKSNR